MPFQKGNTIGQETRWGKGQVANPAGRPPDKLRRFIHAELDARACGPAGVES